MSACVGAVRRRAQARKKLQDRPGVDKVITPNCVDLSIERLEGLGVHLYCRGIRELFWLLQRILHTTGLGASLPLSSFSSLGLGRKLLEGLVQTGLIWCLDPDSWKPRDYDVRNAKARRFLPTTELLVANAGLEVVDSAAAYLAGKYRERLMPLNSTVTLAPDLAFLIPPHISEQLERGTGLSFNLSRTMPLLVEFSDQKGARILQATQRALGCLGNPHPLNTTWIQTSTGRLYAKRPPIINLPSVLRPALEPLDCGIVGVVDLQNFEPRILHAEAGVSAPLGDYAQFIGDQVGLPRENVKAVLNPLLHGQTQGNLVGANEWDKLEDRKEVETLLRSKYPTVWQTIQRVQHDPLLLQRRGAEVFFDVYGSVLTTEGLSAGFPLHDGCVLAVNDEAQLLRVKRVFEEVGTEKLGQPLPTKHLILSDN